MYWRALIHNGSVRLRKWLMVAGAAFVLIWFVFLDSHSLVSRVRWHREQVRLEAENAHLQSLISDLESKLARPLTDQEVERIAREEYGMSRSGEVVYSLEEDQ